MPSDTFKTSSNDTAAETAAPYPPGQGGIVRVPERYGAGDPD
jgi:hypothetical protein